MPGGRPKSYLPEDFLKKFKEYINDCVENKKLANIVGFCNFAEINHDTYYEYSKHEEYSDTIKKIEEMLEDVSIQEAFNAKNPAFLIFYMKNKFGWKDKIETDVNANVNGKFDSNLNLKDVSTDELKKMLKD